MMHVRLHTMMRRAGSITCLAEILCALSGCQSALPADRATAPSSVSDLIPAPAPPGERSVAPAADAEDGAEAPLALVLVWDTRNPTRSGGVSRSIELIPGPGDHAFDVDWDNDGVFEDVGVEGPIKHDYATHGRFAVSVRGALRSARFCAGDDAYRLVEVRQWGDVAWESMESTFEGCAAVQVRAKDVPDLSRVSSMRQMFSGAVALDGGLARWETSHVTDMSELFAGARSFSEDLSAWDTANVTDMSGMFSGARAFDADVSAWDTSSVKDMSRMFADTASFQQRVGGWDTSSVTDMSEMFSGAKSFNQDLSGWDVSRVTTMEGMFSGALEFDSALSTWDVSSVENMANMFSNADAFDADLGAWDVANVTNMASMFSGAKRFNQDISRWRTTSLERADQMFANAVAFDQPLGRWELSSVTQMQGMFEGASAFDRDVSMWDTSNVTNMASMFSGAERFNSDVSKWDVSRVTDFSQMFERARRFRADLSGWDVSNATTMERMFAGASSFDSELSSWDVSQVVSMASMFAGATAFYSDLSGWDVSKVRHMDAMFAFATSFDAALSSWRPAARPRSDARVFVGSPAGARTLTWYDTANDQDEQVVARMARRLSYQGWLAQGPEPDTGVNLMAQQPWTHGVTSTYVEGASPRARRDGSSCSARFIDRSPRLRARARGVSICQELYACGVNVAGSIDALPAEIMIRAVTVRDHVIQVRIMSDSIPDNPILSRCLRETVTQWRPTRGREQVQLSTLEVTRSSSAAQEQR